MAKKKKKDKLLLSYRHPFFKAADEEFGERIVPIGECYGTTWRLWEALYYASLDYDIEYMSEMHEEYKNLEEVGYVKITSNKSVKLTKEGKEMVAWLQKLTLMPGGSWD